MKYALTKGSAVDFYQMSPEERRYPSTERWRQLGLAGDEEGGKSWSINLAIRSSRD